MLQSLVQASGAVLKHAGTSRSTRLYHVYRRAVMQDWYCDSRLLGSATRSAGCESKSGLPVVSPMCQQVWLRQHWQQQQADAYSTDAGPIKSKGMTAGTLPPATEQVPPDNPQKPGKEQAAEAVQQTLAAASERNRPASKSGPPGLDQVPASAQPTSSHQEQQPAEPIVGTGVGANAAAASASDQESASQAAATDTASSQHHQPILQQATAAADPHSQPSPGGWQRFKWLLWGTPPEHWKRSQQSVEQPKAFSSSNNSNADGSTSTTEGTMSGGDRTDGRKSRFSLAAVIERAILRTHVVRDEDVARFASKSMAIAAYTLAGFSVLGTLGVDTKPLVAGLGVGGFTVGFALRDVATNFVSGVLLVLQRPFEKGDRVRVHAGSTALEGIIHSIDLRYIIIKAKDSTTVMIPASIVYANPVVVLKK